ncbi:MAG TPA: tetratricopeptide repeat protein, partial [Thermoanaerobaculia bacterium]|nr:tetratricopeptide repeat protein [Thermoanaerobaculia bacterium]
MKLSSSAALAACLSLFPLTLSAAPPADSDRAAASYQFALGKLMAVEGSVAEALSAFERAEKLAPDSPETVYVLVEHGQLLGRMAQYARNPSQRDDNLRQAAEKVSAARKLAPENLDVLRAVGEVYIDLSATDPTALETAREALETVRRRDPGDAQSFLTLGRIYMDQNQPDKAAQVFQELVNNLPQQRMAYALLVESLVRADKSGEAEKALQEILGFDPGSLEARLTLADLQSRRGDSQAVLETLKAAPEEVREDPRLRRQLAWALYQGGDLPAALAAVEALRTTDPEGQSLGLLKGLILAAQGRNDEALELLSKVREAQPKDVAITATTARVMQRAGRRDEAARLLTGLAEALAKEGKAEEAAQIRMEAAQVYAEGEDWKKVGPALGPLLTDADDAVRLPAVLLQAESLAQDKRYDDALGLLAKEKESPAIASKRAEVLVRAGRDEEAGRILATLATGDEVSTLAAAQAWQRLERHQESIPILEKLTATKPNQPVLGFLLGAAYERTQQTDKAIAELRRVVKIDPEFHAALNYLGYTMAEANVHLEEALELVNRAVALDPDNGSYVDSLGWIYYRMGRPEQAREHLERAVRLDPEDATLQEHLGDVYVALGQKERARQA